MEISIAISDDNSSPCVFKHTLTALSKPCDVIELKNQVKNIQVKCNEYLTTLVEKEKVEGNGSNIITSTASNDDDDSSDFEDAEDETEPESKKPKN